MPFRKVAPTLPSFSPLWPAVGRGQGAGLGLHVGLALRRARPGHGHDYPRFRRGTGGGASILRCATATTPDGSTSYVYDAENRLISASGAHTATLSYDPLGRLWQVAAPSGTTRFVYDGDHIAIEYDGATAALLRAYV